MVHPTINTNVPHLTTALTDIPSQVEKQLSQHQIIIEKWLQEQWQKTTPPFYASVDIRNAGFKISAVDTNLFPGGFNNLNPDFLPLCTQAIQSTLNHIQPNCLRIILIPENHTRNIFYFENLATLQIILSKAGFEVKIGSLREDLIKIEDIQLPSGRKLRFEPLVRKENILSIHGFSPCIIILNNDLSSGIPNILKNIKQNIIPSPLMGWHSRLKSDHFYQYDTVCNEFAELIHMDPWLINPFFEHCENIDFLKSGSEDLLVETIDNLLMDIRKKYVDYHIKKEPFVVIKANSGTYGMGVMMVHSGDEVRHFNRKIRTQMSASKGQKHIDKFLIQEGVYTTEQIGENQHVAEPVVYMIDQYIVGGFYRVHSKKNNTENLNAPGMYFKPLAFAKDGDKLNTTHLENRFYAYSVIARLALVAAAREIAKINEAVVVRQ